MNLWIVMETPFIAFTLVLITTVQGQGILTVTFWMHVYCLFYWLIGLFYCETGIVTLWMHMYVNYLVCFTGWTGVSNCTNGDVELIQDPADTRIVGYVQYCFRGEWGRLCREYGHMTLWDDSEAAVACRQLGYTSTGEVLDCKNYK